MTKSPHKTSNIYKNELIQREEQRFEHQLWLKRRVRDTYKNLLDMFTKVPLEGGRFLDTGSANEAFEHVCREVNIECESLDIDMGVDFEKDPFPFEDKRFKFVNSNSVIEHLHHPTNYLQEIHRVLSDDGYLFLVTPNWPYCWKTFYNSYTHYQPYSRKSINDALTGHGFETIAIVPWLVLKSRLWWRIPAPYSFWLAKNLLLFPGTMKGIPSFIKGKSSTMLVLARKKM